MEQKKTTFAYKIIRWLVWFFYPKTTVEGAENLPDEPCVIVGNHTQMHGPLVSELYLPGRHDTWCAGDMMELRAVPAYAYKDFWSNKPRSIRWFYKLLSYLIAPLAACIFHNANTLPVYRDQRVVTTFRLSIERLKNGVSLVIFPETYRRHNNIVYDFQDRFIDLARMYHKKTGKALCFVPVYIAPAFHKAYFGKPIRYDPTAPKDAERRRVCEYLMDEISRVAWSLPAHAVVPYPNVSKKHYPQSLPPEVYDREEKTV